MPRHPTNVILVDDDSIIHEALKQAAAPISTLQLIAYAHCAREALELFGRVPADVAVIDVLMPELNGFEIARHALRVDPKLRVLFFTGLNSSPYIQHARDLGAAGWIVKDSMTELVDAIQNAAAGAPFICPNPDHGAVILPSIDAPVIPTQGKEALTPREIEILHLTVASYEVKEIADRLGISARTVEVHRAHIFQKLHTRSLARLTKYAISKGYTPL